MKNRTNIRRQSSPADQRVVQSTCLRCGTCCRKGGPALHGPDLVLLEKGHIPLKDLFTIRQGELSYDNIRETIQPASSDIIKLKGKPNRQECIFFNARNAGCRIYAHRPLECRTLQCWNTDDILSLYSKDRLNRKTILNAVPDLSDMVQDHHARCSYPAIALLTEQIKSQKKADEAFQKLNDMIQYDNSLRNVLAERSRNLSAMTEFLLGRPLTRTIKMFGLPLPE